MSRLSSRALAQSAVLLACTLCWFCATPALAQGTYNWNTTSGTWNTTDANWSGAGSTWVNGTSSNAVFNNTNNATVTISGSIAAGDVSFGDTSNFLNWTLSGGTLSAAGNFVYQGNGNAFPGNAPTLNANSNVSVAGSTLVGRANLNINGGTFTTNRITANPASADWATFNMFGGSVTATNGVDGTYGTNGSNGTTVTFGVLLQGGTLSTTYLKVADREAGTNNNAWLTLNSTVVRALTSTSSFIQTYGGGSNVFIAASGAYFDSNGFDIGVDRTLTNYPGQAGFLVKQGTGTLTLSGANTYSNGTTVSGGRLIAGGTAAFGSGGVTVNGGIASLAGYTVANAFTLTSGTLLGASGTSGVGSIAVGSGVIDPAGGRLNAGAVTIGNTGANPGTTTPFSGNGVLAASSFIVQGNGNNGPGGGPVTLSSGTLTTSGNLGVGRWSLTLGGSSTVTVSGTMGGGGIVSSADWGTLTIRDNAVVTATGGVNGNAEAWQLNLNGGTLNTRSIQASDRESPGSTARLVFNGTRIVATASNASFVTVGANGGATNSALVGNGGVDIDSNGFDLGIGINLRPDTSSTGGLTKRGAGTLTLTGANTYTGATSINAGKLSVNGSLGNTAVSVASGATLGGSGSLAGPVNVLGTLSPGNSPGVITLGSLVLGGTSTTLIEITGTSRGTAYDGVDITTSSGLTYGGLLSLDFSSLGLAVPNDTTFDIFSFLGSPSGNFSSVTSTGLYAGTWTSLGSGSFQLVSGAQTLTFSQATGDIIVVPEPASFALAAIGLATGVAIYRRRRA